MNRRSFLLLSAALGLAAAPRVGFGAPLKELRVGYQKTAILLVVKARKLLENRKVAVARGSSAHNLLVTALEAANLAWSDISPVSLAPADAASAFARGAVDARSIWDPFYAIAELRENARPLPPDPKAAVQNSFFLASRDFLAARRDTDGRSSTSSPAAIRSNSRATESFSTTTSATR